MMLQRLNAFLEKAMPLITPTSLVLGVLFAEHLKSFTFLVPWLFAVMTFSGSLSSNFRDFAKVITEPLPIVANIGVLHIVMPLVAWGVGSLLYGSDHLTITGLILGLVIPTGITSLIWVSIYVGNVPLTLSIILIDTFLSPIVVPLSLFILVGTKVDMDIGSMMQGLLWMIVLPSLLGMLLNQWTKGKAKTVLGPKLSPFSKLGIGLVVAINSSVVAPYLSDINWKLIGIALTVLLLASLGYAGGWITGKLLRWNRDVIVTLTYNTGMRNISTGAVLALAYFPPAATLPVILAMLFQQLLASLFGLLLHKAYGVKREKPGGSGAAASSAGSGASTNSLST